MEAGVRHPRLVLVGRIQRRGIAVEVQNPLGALVVGEPLLLAQRLEAVVAVRRKPEGDLLGALEMRSRAMAQKVDGPAPLREVGAKTKQVGRILAPEPLDQHAGHFGVRPGSGAVCPHDPAVGEAGLQAGTGLPLHHSDVVAGLVQEVGGRRTDDPGAEHQDAHCPPPAAGPYRVRSTRSPPRAGPRRRRLPP